MADSIFDLFGPDDSAAQNQATALANAIRQRQAAGLALTALTGDRRAISGLGSELAGAQPAEQALIPVAQQRAAQDIQRQHYANEAAWREAMLGVNQERADTARLLAGLKAGERTVTHDMWGNPVTVMKYADGHVGPIGPASGGAATAPESATPAAPPRRLLPLSNPGPAPAPRPAALGGQGGTMVGPPRGAGMSQDAFDQTAEQAYRTGKFPSYGKATGAMTAALQARIAQLHPGADLASTHAGYSADSKSLNKQQQLLDMTQSWESTGKSNLAVLRQAAQDLANTGSPWLNKPVRAWLEGATGDPNVTRFKAAHSAVVNEYAKILSGAMGAGGVTEGSRQEAENMLPLNSTPAQVAAAADVLERDAGNRLGSLQAQLKATQARLGAHSAPPSPAAPDGIPTVRTPDEARKLPPGTTFKTPDGRIKVR